MMTHDPYQNLQALAAYFGGATPFGLPYTPYQPSFNPISFAGQPQANPGIGGYGIYPNQLQGMGTAGQLGPLQQLLTQTSLAGGLLNPLLQHALAQGSLQNPQLGYHGWPQLQQQQYGYPQPPQQNLTGPVGIAQPFGQQFGYPQPPQQNLTGPGGVGQSFGQQFGYPLAPQSLIGAGGIGQPFGQVHPLAQMALRQAAGYGISPWAGSF